MALHAHVDASPEKCPDGEHHARGAKLEVHAGAHPAHRAVLEDQVLHRLLEQHQVRTTLERVADERTVQGAIDLGSGRAHRGPLSRVEPAEVDTAVVRSNPHEPAQRVDLLDQVALADTPDGGVAAHLAERLDALREKQGARAEPGARERGFGAGVSAADHDGVEGFGMAHGANP